MHYLYIVLSSIQGHLLGVKGLGIEQGYWGEWWYLEQSFGSQVKTMSSGIEGLTEVGHCGFVVVPIYMLMWVFPPHLNLGVKQIWGLIKVSALEGHGYRRLKCQGECSCRQALLRGQGFDTLVSRSGRVTVPVVFVWECQRNGVPDSADGLNIRRFQGGWVGRRFTGLSHIVSGQGWGGRQWQLFSSESPVKM